MFDRSKWILQQQNDDEVKKLVAGLRISPICAKLLINRGYCNPDSAKIFLNKTDTELYNPFLLADIGKAVSRIRKAIENEEKVTIYGDYDVDGVTSVSILYMYLRDRGVTVDFYIPTRENEGYGLNIAAFDTIKEKGTRLVITVDTGITAIDEIKYANQMGLDVVVTDHHQCRDELPPAIAVVNPRRPDCTYPFKELSGVGVIFKVLCALELDYINGGLYNPYTVKDMCKRYIDLVTIGTVADVMPLVGENRIIVYLGLQILNNTHQIGVKALFRTSGIEFDGKRKITSSFIGYTIAPRINAAGRIGDASQAVRLFLSKTSGEADAIAEELCATNRERQSTENQIYIEAIEQIEKNHDLSKENVIVLSSDTWHHGVIGIVASRLTERYNLPSVLISFDGSGESGIGKGSARSVKGLNLVKALAACEDTLCKYGGHELAAGLTVERSRLSEFSERLNTYIGENKDNDSIRNVTVIDSEIESTDINEFTVNAISGLEPFGAGNPVPVFIYKDATIVSLIELSMGKHTKLIIEKDGIVSQAVCFGNNLKKEGFCEGDIIDIVCNMDINEFRGVRNIQFVVRDIDYSDEYKSELSFKQSYIDKLFSGEIKPEPDELPCKDDLSAIYSSMKSMLPSGKGNITIKKLVAQHSSVSYIKAGISLVAFLQSGLINIDKISVFEYRIEVLKTDRKVDIFSVPVLSLK